MSLRRFMCTAAAMVAVGLLLSALSPGWAELVGAVTAPQRVADVAGPESVVLRWTALLAWLAWGWGGLGLLVTAAAALPGGLGAIARVVLHGVLPAGARRAAALLLGAGLGAGIGAPVLALASPASAPSPVSASAPDWPSAGSDPAPPVGAPDGGEPAPGRTAAPGEHVVVRGDCLWDIAAAWLASTGPAPNDAETVAAVREWWAANAAVIGPDPDLLLPGQVLAPPGAR